MTWFGIIVGGIALAAIIYFLRKEGKSGNCGSCCNHCGLHENHFCEDNDADCSQDDDDK